MSSTDSARADSAVNLLTSNGVHAILDVLLPEFRRATGHDVAVRYGTGVEIFERIDAGETADVVIANRAALENLAREGKMFQIVSQISTGIFSGSRNRDVALALLEHLSSPQNAHVYRTKGMEAG